MSRTHKTKPYWVKLRQGHIKTVEDHDHTDGVCNIPAVPDQGWFGARHRDCGYQPVWDGRNWSCSCCHYPSEKSEWEQRERRELRDHPERWDGEWIDYNTCYGCAWCDSDHAS